MTTDYRVLIAYLGLVRRLIVEKKIESTVYNLGVGSPGTRYIHINTYIYSAHIYIYKYI